MNLTSGNINFSQFAKNLYIKNAMTSSQGGFVYAIFTAAGSQHFKKQETYTSDSLEYALYNGKTNLSTNIAATLLKSSGKTTYYELVNKENLKIFLNDYISESDYLLNVMSKFGLTSDCTQNKPLFIEALCVQFKNIVKNAPQDVKNIVHIEYKRLVQKSEIKKRSVADRTAKKLIQIEIKNMEDDLDNLRNISKTVNELMRLLKSYDLTSPFPLKIETLSNMVDVYIADTTFYGKEIKNITYELCKETSGLFDYLFKHTKVIGGDFKRPLLFAPDGEINGDFDEYVETVLEKRQSYFNALYKFSDYENILKERLNQYIVRQTATANPQ
jgi:hypothetical protein